MSRPSLLSTLLGAASAASLAIAAAGSGTAQQASSPAPRVPIHIDGKDMEQAMLDATHAFVHGDGAAARAAFDRVENGCRRMTHAEDTIWVRNMVNQDMAMHMALDHARDSATRGDLDSSFDSMEWIVRTCRDCHKLRDALGK